MQYYRFSSLLRGTWKKSRDLSIQRLLSMKKIFLITFIFLVSNLFAERWIFNRYGEKGKSDTPNFFILFSSKIEAGEWLSKSNRKLSDLRELETLLGFLKNDMASSQNQALF